LSGLDFVPARWLHLTTQGVGFTDEVSEPDIEAIVSAARSRLAAVPPVRVTLGPARVTPEAILLDVSPAGELAAVRAGLRWAIGDVWSAGQIPDHEEWTPHVSVAYSRSTAPAGPYISALAEDGDRAESVISDVELIILGRDEHLYEWTTRADIRLSY
ncbi:MAG TPA: 2'-5' RNA ligase family protein, partial [Streptosporangiaceae bacterium]|nr:2'-5' RNA ligase family protein [Streptosporangiaceae bacterium]